jgi:hypothetical protein
VLPEGGNLNPAALAPIEQRVREALAFSKQVGEICRNDLARDIWRAVYTELSEGKPGLLGAMIAQIGRAHV